MSTLSFQILPVPLRLQGVVDTFRVATYQGNQAVAVNVCPNGLPGIVFQPHCLIDISTDDGVLKNVPDLFLYGQTTKPSVMHFRPKPYTTIQVLLKPDALQSLFRIDASTLTNNILLAKDFGTSQLESQLLLLHNTAAMVESLEAFLLSHIKRLQVVSDLVVTSALNLIDMELESVRVTDLVDTLHVSERQLRERFNRAVGVPPQLYIRIRRFNKAMHLMDSGEYDRLSDIAHVLDFHDQSHFIRDIKEFSGKTPKGITQKVREFYHDQVGTSFL